MPDGIPASCSERRLGSCDTSPFLRLCYFASDRGWLSRRKEPSAGGIGLIARRDSHSPGSRRLANETPLLLCAGNSRCAFVFFFSPPVSTGVLPAGQLARRGSLQGRQRFRLEDRDSWRPSAGYA